MTVRDVLKRLRADGWVEVRQKGSHVILRHPSKPGHVTVPMHGGDVKPGTLRNIWRQAGLR